MLLANVSPKAAIIMGRAASLIVSRDFISLTAGRIIPRFPNSLCKLSVRSASGVSTRTRCVSCRTSLRVMWAAVVFSFVCHNGSFWNSRRTESIICNWLLHLVMQAVVGRTPKRSVCSVFRVLFLTLLTTFPTFTSSLLMLSCSLMASLIASWSMWMGHLKCKLDTVKYLLIMFLTLAATSSTSICDSSGGPSSSCSALLLLAPMVPSSMSSSSSSVTGKRLNALTMLLALSVTTLITRRSTFQYFRTLSYIW